MNLADVEKLVQDLRTRKMSRAYLQAIKPYGWRPKGFKLRTCFGLVEILNVTDRVTEMNKNPDYTSVVFTVEVCKMERWVAKQKRQA